MVEKMSDTSRIVDRLIVKGLVKKVTCESDRRLVDVQITDKGRKLLERFDLKENEMDEIVKGLNEAEAKELNHLLDKIRQGRE
jgi:DNA-binding MarR family transcriptional regulator